MKLIIITAVKAFEQSVKTLLAENRIVTYSYCPVVGYRDSTREALESNWFGVEMNETASILFFALVPDDLSPNILTSVEVLNETCPSQSKIHIAQVSMDNSNSFI